MSIALFGPPQIKRGKEPLSIQRRKDLALLIYLVVTAQPHSRDTLATLLWQDQGQAGARSNLRKSLSRLKLLLGEQSLLISHDQICLNPKLSIELDIAQFSSRVQQFRKHAHSSNRQGPPLCRDCQAGLEIAADLYRADFLDGFGVSDSSIFEEWQFFQSESLRKNLAELLENLTIQHRHAGDYNTAIEHCRRWLALDRLHEPAHRELMLLYALHGQHAAALRQFDECTRLLKDELDTQPEMETRQLHEMIQKKRVNNLLEVWAQAKSQAPKEHIPTSLALQQKNLHNLPVHPAPFIGRERELGEICRLLEDPSCRLLTLLGPGGNGKTRLALQVASILSSTHESDWPDGIWFIPLAPLTDPQSLVETLIEGLKIAAHVQGADAHRKLLGHVHGKQMLLVLDNFEHLLGPDSVKLITEISSAAGSSKILITSRERLNVEGEYIFRVDGLEIPIEETYHLESQTDTVSTAFSALLLFEQCALRVQPSFKITAENYHPIAQICRNVQGMPLAIELAASWIEILSPQEINDEIKRSLDFLQSNWHDLPDRQRSLRAVFDSSWEMLDGQTRPIIKALSVFRSSFTRDAAQAVSGASTKKLLELTNKSWVQRLSNGRFQIHELLKQFAYEKLSNEQATFEQVRKQYTEFYGRYADTLWNDMKGPRQSQAFSEVEIEFENMHTAWMWLIADGKVDVCVHNMLPALFHYAEIRGKVDELLHMVDAALLSMKRSKKSQRNPDQIKLEIILRTAQGAFHTFDRFPLRFSFFEAIFPANKETIERAWELSQKAVKLQDLGVWGILLAFIYGWIGHSREPIKYLKAVLPHLRKRKQLWELASANLHLTQIVMLDLETRARHIEVIDNYLSEALEIFASLGDEINRSYTLRERGNLRYCEHNLAEAIHYWDTARGSLLAKGEWSTATTLTWKIGNAHLQLGEFDKAFRCFREISQTNLEHGFKHDAVGALSKESYEQVRYGELSEALRIRKQCLDIIHATGPEYQIAWNSWEMGEIWRVWGKFEDATHWYEKAREIFEKHQDDVGRCFYHRGMGDIALTNQDYDSAHQEFSKSAELARVVKHDWALIYTLHGLARSELGLKKPATAKRHLHRALKLADKTGDRGIALVVLTGVCEYLMQQGDMEKAVQLGSLVNSHHASWHETKKQASFSLEALRSCVPPAKFNQAVKKGRSLEIWETIGSLIQAW